MPFEARMYIQGVGVYVPEWTEGEWKEGGPEASTMRVLFPSYDKAFQMGIRDSQGNPVCRHYAVVQFSARCLGGQLGALPDAWTTIDLSGMWLGLTANPARPPRFTINGRVPGVPSIPNVIRQHAPINAVTQAAPQLNLALHPQASVGSTAFLKAGLVLDAGVLSPYAEYEGLYRFPLPQNGSYGSRRSGSCPNPNDQKLSSVLKLELGEVDSFTLHFTSFGTNPSYDLSLQPPSDQGGQWDELEVWVRHYCELDRPDPNGMIAEPGEEDVDFVLNYALLQNLAPVLTTFGNVLPVPSISTSWARGGLIGSEARKCMAAQA